MALKVIYAVYGTTKARVDVTSRCQELINSGKTTIPVNNEFMGDDPDFGVKKSFAIIYQLETALNPFCYIMKDANEGNTLDLL